MRLSEALLSSGDIAVEQLEYDRSKISAGWLHIGLGAFHRAHQSWYLDQLNAHLEKTGQRNSWGLVVANIRDDIGDTLGELAKQDGLYTLTTVDAQDQQDYRIIRSVLDTINGVAHPDLLLDQIANPSTQIVSLTVTEGGYYQRNTDSQLDLDHPTIKEELQGKSWLTVYSYLHKGLRKRFEESGSPITLLCCDNLRGNGHRLDASIQSYLHAANDTELLAWYKANVSCPNAMVDRITPRPSEVYEKTLQERFGYSDKVQVMAEPFCQWVIEDNFKTTRPPLDEVGVEFVKDVEPYEEVKIRILNGGHISIAYLSALRKHTYFDEGMRDEKLMEFFNNYQNKDVLAVMPKVPVDTNQYLNDVRERFLNAGIGDTVARLCSEGYSKFPAFILPTLKSAAKQSHQCDHAFAIVVSWLEFMLAEQQGNVDFKYDEQYQDLTNKIINASDPEAALVAEQALWGELASSKFMSAGLVRGRALLVEYGFLPIS